ncbi:MAG TPA: PfkB family carbohydrate kinase [Spirochaetales bacterium]|nr:PfkB family carbohydrate kinase [Spirochaetales bacterium]
MQNYDIANVGAYTKDTIKTPHEARVQDGGGFYYGANVAQRLGLRTAAVTRLARADFHIVYKLRSLGVDVYAAETPQSTCITLDYRTDNPDERILHITATSGSFTVEQFEGINAKAYVISPSVRGEVPLDVLEFLAKRGGLTAIDVQGYIRTVGKDSVVQYEVWPEMGRFFELASVVKTDAVEAAFLTGERDVVAAAGALIKKGAHEVILTHQDGIVVHDGHTCREAKFCARGNAGRTGRGDTAMTSYMAKRITEPPEAALLWAAAVCSLKLEKSGPFAGSLDEVRALLHSAYGYEEKD